MFLIHPIYKTPYFCQISVMFLLLLLFYSILTFYLDLLPHAVILNERVLPDRPTFCAALTNMKRHDSCSCHNASSSPNIKAATQRIFIVEVTAFCHYTHLCNGAFMFFYYSKTQQAHRLSLLDYYPGRSQQPDLWLIAPLVLLHTE